MDWTHAPNQIKMTPEERLLDRVENIDPPDDKPFRNLACAVILNAAREYRPGSKNVRVKKFFKSEDYDIWAFMAGINVDGDTVFNTLERNGGVSKRVIKELYDRRNGGLY